MADIFNIAGRIHSTSQEEVVTTTDEILDKSQGKKQSEVNSEVGEELSLHTNRLNALTGQNYITVQATQSTTDIPTLINASGEGEQVDTIYRVGFWDGSAYVADKYTEYAWNGTAYVILDVKSSIGEVFDISQYNAVGGTLTTYVDLADALGVDGANVPSSVRRGGMSIKFVQSSDNKYVQFRLTVDEWSSNISDWSFSGDDVIMPSIEYIRVITDDENKILFGIKGDGSVEWFKGVPTAVKNYVDSKIAEIRDGNEGTKLDGLDKIITFLDDFSTSDTLKSLLDSKVDVEDGKSLIDTQYVQTVENEEYIRIVTDDENKIIEGIKSDGKHKFNAGVEISDTVEHSPVSNNEWLSVVTDNSNKVLEGIKPDGSKHISKFDDETKQLIKSISTGGEVFEIPVMDANFGTLLPYKVFNGDIEDNSVKGTENAKYVFNLPLSDDSWLIRFKFRITEDLINQEKDAVIASINGAQVYAKSIPFTQHYEEGTFNDVPYTDKWQTCDGGIVFNKNTMDNKIDPRNIGQQAFSVQYTGNGTAVTLENDGNAIILSVDGNTTSYPFINYNNVSELFEAMKSNANLSLQYIALEMHTCDELVKFPPISLKDTVHTGVSLSDITEHTDAAQFYLWYGVSDKWHQAEIFKKGNTIYSVCDGTLKTYTADSGDELVLGGECTVLFKDLVVCVSGTLDSEVINGYPLSSVSPYILVFETHGMVDKPACEVTVAESDGGMSSLNPDLLEYYFSLLDKKGYIPVTINEIAAYYTSGKPLPKRCYLLVTDDYHFEFCCDNNFRRVFNRHGAKPAMELITKQNTNVNHNGQSITRAQAAEIWKDCGWQLYSHTHNHAPTQITPSEFISYLENDIYQGDLAGLNSDAMGVVGYDNFNLYLHDCLEFMGISVAVEGYWGNGTTNISHKRYRISRVNIGRMLYANGDSYYPYTNYTNKFI